ncbi:hypothetical protein RYX36_018497 [Vicia faba]
MKNSGVKPDFVILCTVLSACGHAGLIEEGQKLFSPMIHEHHISPTREHYGCMVDLYCRSNLWRKAIELIETMPFAPNVIIWGSLMSACQIHGEAELGEFAAKQLLELEPGHHGALNGWKSFYPHPQQLRFPPLLKAISKLSALTYGLEIHGLASKLGFLSDPFIQTALIAMYASCARIMDARLLFAKMSHPDAVAWNTIIDGYCQNGHFDDALSLFDDMKNSGVKPDFVILCAVLSACGHAEPISGEKLLSLSRQFLLRRMLSFGDPLCLLVKFMVKLS